MAKGALKTHTNQTADRRRNTRVHIKQKIACKSHDEFRLLYVTNISKGGVFIKTPFPPPLGSMMRLGLNLPGTGREIEFTGKVVQSQPFGAGVQFLDIKPSDLEVMEQFIRHQEVMASGGIVLEGKLCHSFDDPNLFFGNTPDLKYCSLPTLLRHIQKEGLNGTLRLFKNDEYRNIHIRMGAPVDVSSSKFNENFCLGRLFKRVGAISTAALQASLAEMTRTGRKQGTILMERGELKWEQIQQGLEWQLMLKLDEVLRWSNGTYTFASESVTEDENWVEPELDLEYALFKSIHRQARRQPDMVQQALCSYGNFEVLPNEMRRKNKQHHCLFVSNNEIRWWHHIVHRSPSLQQLSTTPDTDGNSAAFTFALITAGLATLKHPSWNNEIGDDERLTTLISSENYFHRLHLPWTSANKVQIQAAHDRMLKLMPTNSSATLGSKLEEAYQTLSNDFQRRSYRKNFVDRQAMQSMADRLYRLGKLKLSHGAFQEALPLLLSAADLNPGMPEYDHWLDRAKKACKEGA